MTYCAYQEKELSRCSIQEDELAIYAGTMNPQQACPLGPGIGSKNAYVYLWQNGQPLELSAQFRHDKEELDVLEV